MRWWRLGIIAGGATIVVAALVAGRLLPPPLERAAVLSATVLDRDGALVRPFTTPDGTWRLAAAPEQVSRRYLAMLLAVEDRRFMVHPGVDPLALLRAVGQLVLRGRIVSGGSTLTMQVARLLEPRPRTVAAKLIEITRRGQGKTNVYKIGFVVQKRPKPKPLKS